MNGKNQEALEIVEEAREKEYHAPTFAGQLFMGFFQPALLFPYPEQDPEDKQIGDEFIEKISSFLRENLDPEEVDQTHEIPKAVIDGLVKMGAFAMKVPKKYEGLGFSQTNYNRTVMHVASYCGATAVLLSAHQSIGVPQPLKLFGTEEQKKKFFPRFREGSISAFALTESEAGSDPACMSAEAKLSEDGTHYILNGEKLWCTNGTIADIIIVIAKTAPKIIKGKEKKQITSFILEMNTPGVDVIHRCSFMGLNGLYNGVIRFKDVKIPVENRLCDEGRGLAMALATINVGRLTLPAASTGAAKQCLSIARRWGAERIQWGLPVGLHEAGREKISFMAATTFTMDAMSWLTSSWQDQATADIRIEGSMAKLFCTESLWKIVDQTMQLRGGRGYENALSLKARGEIPYPVERIMRDCRINLILEGTSEIMRLLLAREAMDPHLKRLMTLIKGKFSIIEVLKIVGHYLVWYPSQWFRSFYTPPFKELGPLAKHYRFIKKTSHKLARKIFFYMMVHRKKLERKQMLLGRLVEIGTDLFAMSAACSYAISLHKKNPQDHSSIDLAEYFCTMARRRIKNRLYALKHNDDKKSNKLAKSVINKEMRWLEDGIMWMGPDE